MRKQVTLQQHLILKTSDVATLLANYCYNFITTANKVIDCNNYLKLVIEIVQSL